MENSIIDVTNRILSIWIYFKIFYIFLYLYGWTIMMLESRLIKVLVLIILILLCFYDVCIDDVYLMFFRLEKCAEVIGSAKNVRLWWFSFKLRDHSNITLSKRWVGGVRKWQFLMIYSTIYADVSRWMGGPKKAKNMLT